MSRVRRRLWRAYGIVQEAERSGKGPEGGAKWPPPLAWILGPVTSHMAPGVPLLPSAEKFSNPSDVTESVSKSDSRSADSEGLVLSTRLCFVQRSRDGWFRGPSAQSPTFVQNQETLCAHGSEGQQFLELSLFQTICHIHCII